jgi:cyclophilin family peptidyl-prolyl cis-trans isomerase
MTVPGRIIAALLLLAAQAGGQRRADEMSPAEARDFIIAAEDRRLLLPEAIRTPPFETLRRLQSEDLRVIVELTRATNLQTYDRAVRALGRYERRELTPELIQLLAVRPRSETLNAVAQSFRGPAMPLDLSADQIESLIHPTRFVLDPGSDRLPAIARMLGRLPYTKAADLSAVDEYLAAAIERVDREPARRGFAADVARAAESRARRFLRLAPVSEDLVTWLRRIVLNNRRGYSTSARVNAMQALVAARGLDAETLRAAASDDDAEEARRLAALALAGAGSPLAPAERTDTLKNLLADPAPIVRIEAVRAWARQETAVSGCGRLIDAMSDTNLNVVLVAIDALGDQCRTDVSVTDRLEVEARTPPPIEWHRSAHALVALAKRAPEKMAVPLAAHLAHGTWQVRMYAARAAALVDNEVALERLAVDPHDNVREAALGPLRRLKGAESDVPFIAALGRSDYQLLRTAASELKGARTTPEIVTALVGALRRVTLDKRETSRDTRLALLERLRDLGDADQAGALVALLQDFDIAVATSAAATIEHWTGRPQEVTPQLLPRPLLPTEAELVEAATRPARVKLKNGHILHITLHPDVAPLMSVRFLRLAKAGYYNGLTFHRIVPNFVIQGGSPRANEYSGDGPFVHDEIGMAENVRGSVGLSTRGRDTGDAQFFVNLVDNARLDFDYTVFGTIDARDMVLVDAIIEGDAIESITFEKEEK